MIKYIHSYYGGGTRGISTVRFAELMDFPKVDMYAGTSIGGVVALARAYGYTYKEIVELFDKNIKGIFKKGLRHLFFPFNKARYSEKYLESVLREYFGDSPLSRLKPEIFIPAHEWNTNVTFWFKNNKPYTIFDAARSTSAAPTYFKPYRINNMTLLDAGPYVNNPVMWALIYALELWPNDDYRIISIGTGRTGGNEKDPQINLRMVDDIIRMGINGSEGLGHRGLITLSKTLSRVKYTHYNFDIPSNIKLDDTDLATVKILKSAAEKEYERVADQTFSSG